MDTGRLPEEVRENPSPRAMTQPFALGEGPGGEQSLATDTSMDYTAGKVLFFENGILISADLNVYCIAKNVKDDRNVGAVQVW